MVIKRSYLAALVGVLALYLVSRLIALNALPMFIDEATHIGWVFNHDSALAFTVGRLLSHGLFSLALLLPLDALVAVRLVSVVSGLFTVLCVVWVGWRLFSPPVGIVSGLVYTLLPFVFFHDHMAMADNIQVTLSALTVVASIKLIDSPESRWPGPLLLLTLIASVLAKATALPLFAIPFCAVLILDSTRQRWLAAIKWTLPALVAVGVMLYLGYSSGPFSEKAGFGIDQILSNAVTIGDWFWVLLTPAGCLLLLASVVSRDRRVWFLAALCALLPVVFLIVGQTIFSRYILFSTVPAAVLMARWLVEYRRLPAAIVVAVVALALILAQDAYITVAPERANLPAADRWQYIGDWPSGYGIAETVDYLKAQNRALTLLVVDQDGYPSLGLWLALRDMPEILVLRLNTDQPRDVPVKVDLWLLEASNPDKPEGANLVWNYQRPGNTSGLELWQSE